MTTRAILATERAEAKVKSDEAIAAMAAAGVDQPPSNLSTVALKFGSPEYETDQFILVGWLVEQVARLQGELDALKSASKKGAARS